MTASAFLVAMIGTVPYKIHTVLTDNGIQFRPPRYANGPTARYMTHMFTLDRTPALIILAGIYYGAQ